MSPTQAFDDDYDEDADDHLEDDEDEEYFDCGWSPGGGCSMAGSEECDFECPNRDAMIAELNKKRRV